MSKEIKIISWNVNGIRAVLNKGFSEFIKNENPDIFCLQETKAHPEQLDDELKKLGYEFEYWNSAEKKGYSGTACFSKIKPLNIKYGIGIEKHDNEGRVITLEFENFYLINVYTPNSQRELARLKYRQEWNNDFLNYVIRLKETKPVIFCGDLNVAHKKIDLKNPSTNKTTKTKPGNAGFTDTEREDFDKIINADFIDTFRYLYPNEEKYSWWSYMFNSRAKNTGWRIDYFMISKSLKENLIESNMLTNVIGSDHCPIYLIMKDLN